jgi:hypothetical protein
MATQKGTRATLVKLAQVEEARTFLQSLPEKSKEDLSLKEAIDKLREPLQAALAKGYSYQDLAAQLEKQGIKISATTLKNYLPSGKRSGKSQSPAPTRKRAAKQVQSDSSATSVAPDEALAPEKTARRSSRGAKTSTDSKSTTQRTTNQRTASTRSRSSKSSKM